MITPLDEFGQDCQSVTHSLNDDDHVSVLDDSDVVHRETVSPPQVTSESESNLSADASWDPSLEAVQTPPADRQPSVSAEPTPVSCETGVEDVGDADEADIIEATAPHRTRIEPHDVEDPQPGTLAKRNSKSADDRDMIIIAHQEEQLEDQRPDNSIPFPSSAISKGEARRVDYQELFERLRGLSAN